MRAYCALPSTASQSRRRFGLIVDTRRTPVHKLRFSLPYRNGRPSHTFWAGVKLAGMDVTFATTQPEFRRRALRVRVGGYPDTAHILRRANLHGCRCRALLTGARIGAGAVISWSRLPPEQPRSLPDNPPLHE